MDTALAAAALEKPLSQICEEASDYLTEHGWCQGTLRTESGQVCMMGAVYETLGMGKKRNMDWWTADRSVQEVNDVLRELAADLPAVPGREETALAPVPAYNDLVASSHTEVQDQLLKTAKRLRGEGR